MHDLLTINPKRVVNLFKMDLYHLTRGRSFYVMVAIAIFIPVMMLTQMNGANNLMAFIGTGGNHVSTAASSAASGAGMSLSMLNILTGINPPLQIVG